MRLGARSNLVAGVAADAIVRARGCSLKGIPWSLRRLNIATFSSCGDPGAWDWYLVVCIPCCGSGNWLHRDVDPRYHDFGNRGYRCHYWRNRISSSFKKICPSPPLLTETSLDRIDRRRSLRLDTPLSRTAPATTASRTHTNSVTATASTMVRS